MTECRFSVQIQSITSDGHGMFSMCIRHEVRRKFRGRQRSKSLGIYSSDLSCMAFHPPWLFQSRRSNDIDLYRNRLSEYGIKDHSKVLVTEIRAFERKLQVSRKMTFHTQQKEHSTDIRFCTSLDLLH